MLQELTMHYKLHCVKVYISISNEIELTYITVPV